MNKYLKKEIERKIMKENDRIEREMKFIVEKDINKIPKGAVFGKYGRWIKK